MQLPAQRPQIGDVLIDRRDHLEQDASRALFAVWELWAVWHGAPMIIVGFTVAEIAFGVAELLPVTPQARRPAALAP